MQEVAIPFPLQQTQIKKVLWSTDFTDLVSILKLINKYDRRKLI